MVLQNNTPTQSKLIAPEQLCQSGWHVFAPSVVSNDTGDAIAMQLAFKPGSIGEQLLQVPHMLGSHQMVTNVLHEVAVILHSGQLLLLCKVALQQLIMYTCGPTPCKTLRTCNTTLIKMMPSLAQVHVFLQDRGCSEKLQTGDNTIRIRKWLATQRTYLAKVLTACAFAHCH